MSILNPFAEMPNQTVVGLFANRLDAYSGISRLLNAGFAPQQVGYLDPTDVLFGTSAGRSTEPYFRHEVKTGRVLVSAEVAGRASGTRAATMLLESNALEVESLVTNHLHAQLHHPMRKPQRALAA